MTEQLSAIQQEYRRRQLMMLKIFLIGVLLPFALTVAGHYFVPAPAALLRTGMILSMLGTVILTVYAWRFQRCPACGFKLWGTGTLGGQCLGCKSQVRLRKRLRGGRTYQ
jgi:hypothetical protein